MNSRLSPWIATFSTVLISTVLVCAALTTFPQVFLTPTLPAQPLTPTPTAQSAKPVPTGSSCPRGDCAKACLAQLNSIAQTSGSSEARPKGAGHGPRGAQATVLVTYPVNGSQLGAPKYSDTVTSSLSSLQRNTQAQERIWDYFAAIIPADQRTELIYYIASTDGRGGMLASVEQFSGQSQSWALVVDPADAGRPRDLTFTLVHEFGHLLTLNSSQVKPDEAVLQHPDDLQIFSREAASCPRYFASGGCSLPDSYINQFFDLFWTRLYGEWTSVNAAKDQTNYLSLLAHFYGRHPTQFVTPYASTSPEEDMAETWAYFVLNPKPADDSVAHHKVLFLYGFPELVDLRNRIITNICSFASSQ